MCYDGKCSWQHKGIAPQEQGKSRVRMENVLKVSALKSHQ